MGIEALKQQLAEGKITKEQFAASLKELLDAGTITQEAHDEAAKTEPGGNQSGGNQEPAFSESQLAAIQKMMQSEADKVRTKAAADKKALEDELTNLKTAKMTDDEKAQFERDRLTKELGEREAALTKREVELHTIDKLTAAELPLTFKPFLMGATKEDAEKNVEAFGTAWQAAIKAEVEKKFKDNGDDPSNRNKGGGGAKTWKELNLTEQGKLYAENKQKAIDLAKASGVSLN